MNVKKATYKPVFIVGMNGSGTTMLLDLLNNHPNLYGFDLESKIIPYYLNYIKNSSDLKVKTEFYQLFDKVRNEYVFKTINKGKPPPIPENWKELPHDLSAIFDFIFMYFASKEGKKRWCEKTPGYALHIEKIYQLFPGAKFIHIIRDGRSCASSLQRRFGYKPEVSIFRWKKIIREARRQGGLIRPANYFEVHYEKLVKDPQKWLKKICLFIEEPYNRSILSHNRNRTFTGCTEKNIINNVSKWKTILDEDQVNRLDLMAGALLAELNYPTKHPNSDNNPSYYRFMYWMYYGYLKGFVLSLIGNVKQGKFEKLFKKLPFLMTRIRTRYKM